MILKRNVWIIDQIQRHIRTDISERKTRHPDGIRVRITSLVNRSPECARHVTNDHLLVELKRCLDRTQICIPIAEHQVEVVHREIDHVQVGEQVS